MDRTERILDLVALLLDARRPATFEQIRDAFPGEYEGAHEAAMRKFERDKAELLELGVPLAFVKADESTEPMTPAGYVIDRDAYYLPELGFTPEELAVLYSAGSAALASGAFPLHEDLAYALRKIGFFSAEPLPAAKVRVDIDALPRAQAELPERLSALWRAVESRKRVTLDYFSPHTNQETRRVVRPYGLALRRGLWVLVAFCELRQAERTFIVHRIRSLEVNTQKPKAYDFQVPENFELNAYVAQWPWQHRMHAPLVVTVEVHGALVAQVSHLFPHPGVPAGRPSVSLHLSVTDLAGLVRYVLSLGPFVKITGPAQAVEALTTAAHRVLALHGGTP